MTTGSFNDPSGDGNPFGQSPVVLKIRRVVKEIVGTVVHRFPLSQVLSARLPRAAAMSSEIARPHAHGTEYLRGGAYVLGILSFAGFCRHCGLQNCRESWNGFVVGEESASRSR